MSEAKGMWEGLMDFSFRRYATPRMLKFLYAIHLLAGLIAAVAWVVLAFQQAPVQGLLALLGALLEEDVRAVYGRGGLVKEDRASAWRSQMDTGPLIDRCDPPQILPAIRGPVENSVCHDHHHSCRDRRRGCLRARSSG